MENENCKQFTILEDNGWTIECYSPFEIRHDETGSFASGLAAHIISDYYLNDEENYNVRCS